MKLQQLPHQRYIEAVAEAGGPGGPYTPDDWWAEQGPGGASAVLLYRRTTPVTVRDRRVEPVVDADSWPTGCAVLWDQYDGWQYVALEEDGQPGDFPSALPVPVFADPDAVVALLPLLLDGNHHLKPSGNEWKHAGDLDDALAGPGPAGPPTEAGSRVEATVEDLDIGLNPGDRGTVVRHDKATGTTTVDWDFGERQMLRPGHGRFRGLAIGLQDPAPAVRATLVITHPGGVQARRERMVDIRYLAGETRLFAEQTAADLLGRLRESGGPGWLSNHQADAELTITGTRSRTLRGPVDPRAATLGEEIAALARMCSDAWRPISSPPADHQ